RVLLSADDRSRASPAGARRGGVVAESGGRRADIACVAAATRGPVPVRITSRRTQVDRVDRSERDAVPSSRPSAAPVLPNVDRQQRDEHGDRPRVRETNTTAKTIQAIADGTQRREGSKVDPQAVISALATPVAVVGADWRIVMVNSAWERVFGHRSRDCVRRDLFACFPFLADDFAASMLRAAREDRATRLFELEMPGESGRGHRYEIRASCSDDVLLIVEALQPRSFAAASSESREWPDERDEENASLRPLARQMAAVADSAELLELLCDAASLQCHGTGAAVLRLTGHDGAVVAAAGPMSVALGRHFP